MWNQQTRAEKKKKKKKKDALAGYSLCTAALFSNLETRLKKRLWHFFFFFFFYLFAYGVKDLSHLLVLIIFETINVLMAVDASCPLLLLQFLSGSSQESMLWRILRLYFHLCNMFLGSYLC